ncbi:MAG: hypothetical protein JRH19_14975 [Deltaproteobacteria bacterium]|nr:hypothetical protein [Deltaproteobacteria bacterium]
MGSTSSRLRRWLLAALVTVIVLVAALYVFHGTKSAFLWVYMPILHLLVPGELSSDGGRLNLDGRLEAHGLQYRYRKGDLQIEVDLGSGSLTFAPLSWLTDPPFRARNLEIDSVEVRITKHGGDEPRSAPLVPPLPHDAAPPQLPEIPVLRVPFAIDRMQIDSFRVEIREAERTRAIVGPGRITLSGLEPGGGGGDIGLVFADNPEQPPLDIKLSLDAKSPVRGILDVSIALDAAHQDRAIGRIEGTVHLSRPDTDPVFRALVVLSALDAELLNIPLTYLGRERLAGATLNGAAVVIQSKRLGPVTVELELDVAGLQRVQLEPGSEFPAIGLHTALAGDWQPDRGRIDLQKFHAKLHRGGRDRLRVDLADPVSLVLPGHDDADELLFPGHAKIVATADGIDLAELPHALAILGQHPELPLAGGLVSGSLTVDIEDMGKHLKSSGTLRVANVRLSKKLLGREIEPFGLHARLDGQLDTFERLLVRQLEVDVKRRELDLASLALHGTWDGSRDTTDLDIDLRSNSLSTLLRELELTPEVSALRLDGGGVEAQVQLHMAEDRPELDISTTLQVSKLALSRSGGSRLGLDLQLSGDAKLERKTGDLQLRRVELQLQPRGEPGPGHIRVTGVIPTREGGSDSVPALRLEIENLAARPWLTLAGVSDPGLGPLTVAGELAIEVAGEPLTIELAGSPSLRLRPDSASSEEEAITVTVDGRVGIVPGKETRFAAHLISGSDDLDIDGVLKSGERPQLHVSTAVRSLQLRRYEALLARESEPAQEATLANAPATTTKPRAALLPLDLHARGEIASLHYGEVHLSDAKLDFKVVGADLEVDLAEAKLSGGTLRGSLKRRVQESSGAEQLEIDLHGKQVELGPILAEVAPDIGIKQGLLDLTLSGTAETPRDHVLLDTFEGDLTLLLSSGRIVSKGFNAALAGDLFTRNLQGLVFDGLDAQVTIAEGVAHLVRMRVHGSAARLNIEGQATLRGEVNARISTEIGPELQGIMQRRGVAAGAVSRVGNLMVVPVQITAVGKIPDIHYAARAGLPGQPLGGAGGTVGDVTQGTLETIGDALRLGVGILTGGGTRDQPAESEPAKPE